MKISARKNLRFVILLVLGGVLATYGWWWWSRPVLRLYLWNDYIYADVIRDFEREFNVRTSVQYYRSNAEMMARLKVNWNEFDVIMPSNYVVASMRQRSLLERISDIDVPRRKNVSPEFLSDPRSTVQTGESSPINFGAPAAKIRKATTAELLDAELPRLPDSDYAVPYLWNCQGIGYFKSDFSSSKTDGGLNPPHTWKEFFDPGMARRFGSRLAMLGEPRELIGLVLISLGKDPNTKNLEDIRAAGRVLRSLQTRDKPRLVLSEGGPILESGEAALLQTWSPEVTRVQLGMPAESSGIVARLQAWGLGLFGSFTDLFDSTAGPRRENSNIGYVMPEDGSLITWDTLAIPRSSSQKKLAAQFINFLLDPKIAARVSGDSLYANTLKNSAAPQLLANSSSYKKPPTGKAFVLSDVGDAEHLYDALWAEFTRANQDDP